MNIGIPKKENKLMSISLQFNSNSGSAGLEIWVYIENEVEQNMNERPINICYIF